MSAPQSMDNILSFSPKKKDNHFSNTDEKNTQTKIHPAVRRRRLLWLGCMTVFIFWFLMQIIFQQFRIWDREEKISMKQMEIQSVEGQLLKAKESIKKLKREDYLLELAHKLGYRSQDEEIYQIENE